MRSLTEQQAAKENVSRSDRMKPFAISITASEEEVDIRDKETEPSAYDTHSNHHA